MSALVLVGDHDGMYAMRSGSRSLKGRRADHGHAVTAAVATGTARAGWDRGDFLDVMLTYGSAAGLHARQIEHRRGHDRAVSYLNRVWEQAKDLITRTGIGSRQDAIADLLALRDRITCAVWRGTAGATALRVLMAHWHAAKRAGGRMHTLSYREASEIAGCTVATAYKATRKRLTRWLRQVDSGSASEGSRWVLLDGSRSHDQHTPQGPKAGGAPSNVSELRTGDLDGAVIEHLMSLDAFAHRGLGSSSLKLLAALSRRDGQSIKELIETATVSQATAYRHLKRLSEYGLVQRTLEVWELTETAQEALSGAWEGWHDVAAQEGTYGTSWRRQQLHEAQRAVWHGQVLPRLRERRMPDVTPIRGDEADPSWVCDGKIVDPVTGEVFQDLVVASDGRLMVVDEEPDYDELCRRALAAA